MGPPKKRTVDVATNHTGDIAGWFHASTPTLPQQCPPQRNLRIRLARISLTRNAGSDEPDWGFSPDLDKAKLNAP